MITTVLFQVFVLIGLFLTIPLVQDKRDHKTEFVKPEKILRANKQHLDIFAFSNKEPVLISAGGDFTIRLWDVKTGNEVKAIYVGKRLELVKSSADGACVITYSNDNQLAFWNIATGKQWANIDCKTLLDISPDEKSIIALGADNTVIKVNTLTGKKEASFQEKSQPVDVGAAFICDGKKLLTWHRGAGVFLWNAINGERLKRIASLDVMYGMAISADEKMIAQVGVRNELIVADINSGMELLKSSYDDKLYKVAFSKSGKYIAASTDGAVLLLDAAKGSIVAKLKLSSDGPGSGVEFSPSGETLAAGSYDTSICLWSMSKIVPKVTK